MNFIPAKAGINGEERTNAMKVFGVSIITILVVIAVFYLGRKTTIGAGLFAPLTN